MSAPKGRILCAGYDADTRDLIIFILQNEGYEVTCRDTAEQAISLAKTQCFDLYLVDSWLPNSSGSMLTKKIRDLDTHTRILFYSAAAYETDKDDARSAGAQGYLVKPVTNEKLVAEVIRLLADSQVARPSRLD